MEDSLLISKETAEASELLKEKLAKKITRIPFYKLEELKKIEEKKLKNIHKFKKKEKEKEKEEANILKTNAKKLKKSKKHKDENKQLPKPIEEMNLLAVESSIEHTPQEISSSSLPKKTLTQNVKSSTSLLPSSSSTGNRLHDLKYQNTFKIPRKYRLRLSKKQMRIQYPENSLASFLTQEDKATIANLINNMNSNKKSESDILNEKKHKKKLNVSKDSDSLFNSTSGFKSDIFVKDDDREKSIISNVINNTNSSMKIEEKEEKDNDEKENNDKENKEEEKQVVNLEECIKKKRKRFTKYKKAIYKYRLEKKQYLYHTIFDEKGEMNNISSDKDKVITTDNLPPSIQPSNQTSKEVQYSNTSPNHQNQPILKQRNFDMYNGGTPNTLMMNYYGYPNTQNEYSYHPYFPYYQYYDYYYNNNNNYKPIQTDPNNKFTFEYVINRRDLNLNPVSNQNRMSNIINNNLISNNEGSISQNSNQISVRDIQKKYQNDKQNKFSFEQNNNINTVIPINSKGNQRENSKSKENQFEKFKKHLKDTYHMEDIDIKNLNGKELTEFLKNHKDIEKINLHQIQTFIPEEIMKKYLVEYEGLQNPSQKKIIREYVDQILDKSLDEKFSKFIEKLRDLYYKKKSVAPLKAKKRFVVGMREIEKFIRLNQVLCLFVVPNIEKVSGDKNSLDERLLKIFCSCRGNSIPIFFGLNKFKLGKAARKKMSCVSMLGFINVEGLENDLKSLIQYGEKFRKDWYLKHYDQKEELGKNKFITYNLFEIYKNENETLNQEQDKNGNTSINT